MSKPAKAFIVVGIVALLLILPTVSEPAMADTATTSIRMLPPTGCSASSFGLLGWIDDHNTALGCLNGFQADNSGDLAMSGQASIGSAVISQSLSVGGPVGIGTTNPLSNLHIVQTTQHLDNSGPTSNGLIIEHNGATDGGSARIALVDTNGSDVLHALSWQMDNAGGTFRIYPQPNIHTAGTPSLLITSSGNVGIGTTLPPSAMLEVNGGSQFDSWVQLGQAINVQNPAVGGANVPNAGRCLSSITTDCPKFGVNFNDVVANFITGNGTVGGVIWPDGSGDLAMGALTFKSTGVSIGTAANPVSFCLNGSCVTKLNGGTNQQLASTTTPNLNASCPAGMVVTGFANGVPQCSPISSGPSLAGLSCPSGQALTGINTDGTARCASTLPPVCTGSNYLQFDGMNFQCVPASMLGFCTGAKK